MASMWNVVTSRISAIATQYRFKRNVEAVRRSGLFDPAWYLSQNPDVEAAGMDPVIHYLRYGAKEGRRPSPIFDAEAYLSANPDLLGADVNPLLHYLMHGRHEGRGVCPSEADKERSEAPAEEVLTDYGPVASVLRCGAEAIAHSKLSICVQVHLFHTEQAQEVARYLSNIPVRFTLLVSIRQGEQAECWEMFFARRLTRLERCVVRHAPNRGRDILPWAVLFREEILAHDLFVHVHTKKSDYSEALGGWRAFLFHHVVGSVGVVSDIIRVFEENHRIGLLYPPYFRGLRGQPKWGANKDAASLLLRRMKLGTAPEECPDFPAGSFFWCRTSAIEPLLTLGLSEEDFENEAGQIDGTLAHAIERVVALLCESKGYAKVCAAVDLPYDNPVVRSFTLQLAGSALSSERQGVRSVLVSAFYLPQFHPVDVNDANWGVGFTEWSNVVRARPRFPGHFQPKLPGSLGFYDLRLRDVHARQIELARRYGVNSFCMYYYRFGRTRLMDEPVRVFREIEQSDVTYCYCWANESWTRAWDGQTSEVILEQRYDEPTLAGVVDDLVEAINGPSYQFVDGRPVFMIYQVAAMPEPKAWVEAIRTHVRERTGHALIVGSVFSAGFGQEHLACLDFVVQFPPHRMPRRSERRLMSPTALAPFEPDRDDYFESYSDVIEAALNLDALLPRMMMGVCPDWDNSSRRQRKAHVVIGGSPYDFQMWVAAAKEATLTRCDEGLIFAPMLFVNAWNEWAEGAMLEPSAHLGYAYLEALKAGLGEQPADDSQDRVRSCVEAVMGTDIPSEIE